MAGFDWNTKFVQLMIDVVHEGQHATRDGAKVVVVELLTFWTGSAKQGAAGAE